MKKVRTLIASVLVLVLAVLAYVWFSGGSGEPTTPVTAPPVTTAPASVTTAANQEAPTTAPTSDPAAETTLAEVLPTSMSIPRDDPEEVPSVVYGIDQSSSSVRFEIDEILNGSPKRVVGTTTEVAGEMLIDFTDPTASRLGTVVINVRTLETDSSFRDRAMRGPILGSASDENEFAVFEPTAIEGLPDLVAIGDSVTLAVTGDFTLSGVTRSVVFDMQVTVVSEDRIEVSGSATVQRSDFGLAIPSVPSVSDVSDEILLAVDLVAVAIGG